MCRANWQSQRVRYFLRPTKLRWSRPRKENLREGTKTPGWVYSQTRSTGLNGQLPCIFDRQRRLPKTLRDHVRSTSALSALKKSLVANLSAKRQLSVAKLSAKRIFSLAKRDFLVANGRMAADFSSPDSPLCLTSFLSENKNYDLIMCSAPFVKKKTPNQVTYECSTCYFYWSKVVFFNVVFVCLLLQTAFDLTVSNHYNVEFEQCRADQPIQPKVSWNERRK